MKMPILVLIICALSSISAANAMTQQNSVALREHAVIPLRQIAGEKKCTTTWVTKWVTKWVNTAKGRVQQRMQVRTPTAVCGVRG